MSFDQYYEAKASPDKESEGSIVVAGFHGVRIPLIKRESTKIIVNNGKGEKRKKKKEAMVKCHL